MNEAQFQGTLPFRFFDESVDIGNRLNEVMRLSGVSWSEMELGVAPCGMIRMDLVGE